MTVTISLSQFAISILIICTIILIVYLIVTLSKLNTTIKSVNYFIDANRDNIDKSIKSFPDICDNVNCITKSVKEKTDVLDNYLVGSDESAATLDVESLVNGISSIVELVTNVKDYFKGRKKKHFKRKL